MDINYQLEEGFIALTSSRINLLKIRFTCLWKGDNIYVDIGPQFFESEPLFEMASFPSEDFNEYWNMQTFKYRQIMPCLTEELQKELDRHNSAILEILKKHGK